MSLTDAERRELLSRARRAGESALGLPVRGPVLSPPKDRLAETGAAFVTWKREGRLRGCIGTVEPHRPLAADVEANAVSALLHDPRFPPATAREFSRYRLEISVLGPFERIEGAQDVTIGLHGLYVDKGRRRGLLLPQVAVEWKWDVETFLTQLCLKAGLPEDGWRAVGPPAVLYRFVAEVFGEES